MGHVTICILLLESLCILYLYFGVLYAYIIGVSYYYVNPTAKLLLDNVAGDIVGW